MNETEKRGFALPISVLVALEELMLRHDSREEKEKKKTQFDGWMDGSVHRADL